MSGLEKLVHLKDLSLAHNFIEHLSGIHTLPQLQVVSLAYNVISDLSAAVRYLRRLDSLQSLCLRGNKFSPIPTHPGDHENTEKFMSYQKYCVAFLPAIVYIDFQTVESETVSN